MCGCNKRRADRTAVTAAGSGDNFEAEAPDGTKTVHATHLEAAAAAGLVNGKVRPTDAPVTNEQG